MSSIESLTKIKDAWQPFYPGEELTLEDAQNITNRLATFFQLLAEVDMED